MSIRRHALVVAALLASGPIAFSFAGAAAAQTYGAEALPPPPPDQDEGQDGVPAADALPPAQAPDQYAFEQGLSPYGRWVDTPEYGRVWVPSETAPDWQPYSDGRWVDTEWGCTVISPGSPGPAPTRKTVMTGGIYVAAPADTHRAPLPPFLAVPLLPRFARFRCRASSGRRRRCGSRPPAGFVYGRHWPGWVVVAGTHFTRPIARFRVSPARSAPIVRAANPVAAIASRQAQGVLRGGGSSWGRGNVRQGGGSSGVRAVVPARNVKGFQRSTFRSGGTFRGSANGGANRTFTARGASRSWSPGAGRTFGGSMRSAVSASGGFGRRR